MRNLQDAVINTLRARFPEMGTSIRSLNVELDDTTESQVSYPAPGILVTVINAEEVPEEFAPWELRCNLGAVIAVKQASADKRDAEGWRLTTRVGECVYRNLFGLSALYFRPAVITNMNRNIVRTPDGMPTGVSYWTSTFYIWAKFEGLF